jgi:hypothetical protein
MGSTFHAINLDIEAWPQDEYPKFVTALRAAVTALKEERLGWYVDLQRKYQWVTRLRHKMVVLGVGAALATAAATVARVFDLKLADKGADIWLLVVAVLLYAVMAAMAFYERMEEGSGHYFRSVLTILQIRDQWTDYQFKDAVLSLEPAPAAADLVAMKKRWLDLAQAFVVAIDKQATTELNEWHTAFSTAIKDLSDAATTGLKTAQDTLDKTVKERLEQARKEVEDARKEAEDAKKAARPGSALVKVDDTSNAEATVRLDGAIVRHGLERHFVVPNIPQGRHVIRVEIAAVGASPAKADETVKDFTADILEVALKPV